MNKIYLPTLQQMRLFEAVARHQSITRAAAEVNLSQPTVSMQIKSLENKIGSPLTQHVGKSIELTPIGQEVAQTAGDVLGCFKQMEATIDGLRQQVSGQLSVAAVSSAKYFLPKLIGAFKRKFPLVEPRLQIANRELILDRIARRADDLYIMGQPPVEKTADAHVVSENVIVLAAAPDHPLVSKTDIPPAVIAGQNIIGRESGSGTRKAVENFFHEHGCTFHPHMEFDDSEAIKQAAASGLGIAYISLHALRLELGAGELKILNVQGFPLRRRWYAVHHGDAQLSRATHSFLDFLRKDDAHPPLS